MGHVVCLLSVRCAEYKRGGGQGQGLGPGDLDKLRVSVFFGGGDASARGDAAAALVDDFDGGFVGADGFYDGMSVLADPDLQNVGCLERVIAGAQDERTPGDDDFAAAAFGCDIGEWAVVGRLGQVVIVWMDEGGGERVAVDVHQVGFYPARFVVAAGLGEQPRAVVVAAKNILVCALVKSVKI